MERRNRPLMGLIFLVYSLLISPTSGLFLIIGKYFSFMLGLCAEVQQ